MGLLDTIRSWLRAPAPEAPLDPPLPEPSEPEPSEPEPSEPEPYILALRPPAEPELPLLRDLELEDGIAAAPDRIEAYLVYADWLIERDDPRGELIAVQCALETADLDARPPLREWERELLSAHLRHLAGPAADFEYRMYRGFVRHVHAWKHDDQSGPLLRLIEADHPATRLLCSIKAPYQDETRLREALSAHHLLHVRLITDPQDPVFDPDEIGTLEGVVQIEAVRDEIAFTAHVEIPVEGYPDHAWLARTQIRTLTGTREWWYGGGAAVSEESVHDDPPFCGTGHVPPFEGEAELQVQMCVRIHGPRTRVLWLEGSARASARARQVPLLLRRRGPIAGPPFEIPAPASLSVTVGPALIEGPEAHPGTANARGAVLPGVGVYDADTGQLQTEQGPVPAGIRLPPGGVYVDRSVGGPDGALLIAVQEPLKGSWLVLSRLPGGESRHMRLGNLVLLAAFDETGARVAVVAADFQRGSRLVVLDVGTMTELASTPCTSEPDSLSWRGDTVLLCEDAEATELDAATSEVRTRPLPRTVGLGWRQYGAGAPTWNPVPDRVARMICATFPDPTINDPSGTTLVDWADRDGSHGAVAIPDHGWANRARFGRIAVLDDGRIVAIGTRVWLVDPDDRTAADLGPAAGGYPHPLHLTREGGRWRLWAYGAGPWWIEIPERSA